MGSVGWPCLRGGSAALRESASPHEKKRLCHARLRPGISLSSAADTAVRSQRTFCWIGGNVFDEKVRFTCRRYPKSAFCTFCVYRRLTKKYYLCVQNGAAREKMQYPSIKARL